MTDRPEPTALPGWSRWRVLQGVTACWLLASPAAYGPQAAAAVVAKDLVAGLLLLVVTLTAVAGRRQPVTEEIACVVLGSLLVAASLALDHSGQGGPLVAQWNELAVGVLLVCLGAVRAR